jgi:hypothetical protein
MATIQSEKISKRVRAGLKRMLSDQVVPFVALKPTIQETNELIGFVRPNGTIHQNLVKETWKQKKDLTKEDFDLLNKPTSERTREYKTLMHSILKSLNQNVSLEESHANSEISK